MRIESHVTTTQGRRDTNQDRACAEQTTLGGKPALVLAVADGMGGMRDGDRAAEIAIAAVRAFARDVLPALPLSAGPVRDGLVRLFQSANALVFEFGQQQGNSGSVGTTLVCAVIAQGAYLLANAGDSRAYYVNNHEARQLTRDHSHVADLVASGTMTAEAARKSPFRNQLTNSLGEPGEIQVDLFPASVNVGVIDEDCALLLCSDGLHGDVSETDLFAQLHGTKALDAAAANLLSLAFQRGSTDNITAAIAEAGVLARKAPRVAPLTPVEDLRRQPAQALRAGKRRRVWLPAALIGTAALLLVAGTFVFFNMPLRGGGQLATPAVRPGALAAEASPPSESPTTATPPKSMPPEAEIPESRTLRTRKAKGDSQRPASPPVAVSTPAAPFSQPLATPASSPVPPPVPSSPAPADPAAATAAATATASDKRAAASPPVLSSATTPASAGDAPAIEPAASESGRAGWDAGLNCAVRDRRVLLRWAPYPGDASRLVYSLQFTVNEMKFGLAKLTDAPRYDWDVPASFSPARMAAVVTVLSEGKVSLGSARCDVPFRTGK